MFLLDETPDTVAYMLAGYAVLVGFPILYVLSWIFRRGGLKREEEMLKAMQAEQEAARQAPKK
jgi:hypothetical protein